MSRVGFLSKTKKQKLFGFSDDEGEIYRAPPQQDVDFKYLFTLISPEDYWEVFTSS